MKHNIEERDDTPIVESEFIATVTSCIAQVMGIAQKDVPLDEPMASFGLTSISIIKLFSKLEEHYDRVFQPTLVYSYPTISKLAKAISHIERDKKYKDDTVVKEKKPFLKDTHGPIAIVGMAGRMPGAKDMNEFWSHLVHGDDLISEIPSGRWDWKAPEIDKPIKWGAFMQGVDEFDANFFGISPYEAALMDPQQRLFLQTVWHTLEDAAICPESLNGSSTGVFVGVSSGDYYVLSRAHNVVVEGHSSMGCAHSILPNRVSYLLNLQGPSEPIDTACSSSLVAIHRAVQSIEIGECDMAIAGGVNVMLTPTLHTAFAKAGMLSEEGRCKTFDKGADGYVRGEGVGALFLKRLSRAEADGDRIYALIEGSAVSHGGRGNSLTAPNEAAQAKVLVKAYQKANIDPATVGYIEAHGTGTVLGDPVEINGIKQAFQKLYKQWGHSDATDYKVGIGSVKTNIGHLESAAGIAGIFKVLLAMKHKTIPMNLHFRELNPYIKLQDSPFYIVNATTPWEARYDKDDHAIPRRAGISSFGFGGVNAHVVLEEYVGSHQQFEGDAAVIDNPVLVVLSAKNSDRLHECAKQLIAFVKNRSFTPEEWAALAYTLQVGKTAMGERLALTANAPRMLVDQLQAWLHGPNMHTPHGVYRGAANGKPNDMASLFANDEDMREIYSTWFTRKNYDKLLTAWVHGVDLDWMQLYRGDTKPLPMSAPLYPFAKTRHWITVEKKTDGASEKCDIDELITLKPVWHPEHAIEKNYASPPKRVLLVGADERLEQLLRERISPVQALAVRPGAGVSPLQNALNAANYDPSSDHLIWIVPPSGATSASDEKLIRGQEDGVLGFFYLIKALTLLHMARQPLKVSVVVQGAQKILAQQAHDPASAGVLGLVGCLSKEYPKWSLGIFDVPLNDLNLEGSGATVAKRLDEIIDTILYGGSNDISKGEVLAYRGGQWYQQKLAPITLPEADAKIYRQGGVYVIIGGAGGLGEVWTQDVVRKYQAQVIWLGRRPLCDEIKAKQNRIASFGPKPEYLNADAANFQSLQNAFHTIKGKYGAVHGVVHAALVLADHSLADMDENAFRAALSAKVDGTVHLAGVVEGMPLDFILFFSSMNAFVKIPGQSNYAAGCCFQDSLSQMLSRERPATAVKVINWGYWGSVGVVSTEVYRGRMALLGIGSIEPAEGLSTLAALCAHPIDQLAAIKIKNRAILTTLHVDGTETLSYASPNNADPSTVDQTKVDDGFFLHLDDPIDNHLQDQLNAHAREKQVIDQHLAELLYVELASLGVFGHLAQGTRVGKIAEMVGIGGFYVKWLHASIDLLTDHFNLQDRVRLASLSLDRATVWRKLDAYKESPHTMKHTGAQAEFLTAALQSLQQIVSGRKRATDALFPNGGMALVEQIYRNNAQADYANEMICRSLTRYVRHRKATAPDRALRILEIGAGTGGGTAAILEALTPYREVIAEYCYTDISKAFLLHGENRFGKKYPYLSYKTLDISKEPASQDVRVGAYDVVIACNVLHATRNIRKTLRNVKAALRRNGIILLSEMKEATLFSHLTFGLLEGWWRYEDETLRVPCCPALSPGTWRTVLQEAGFASVTFPVKDGHQHGQQIVVGVSDGIIYHPAQTADSIIHTPENKIKPEPVRPKVLVVEHEGIAAHGVKQQLITLLAATLRIDPGTIDEDTSFADYGVDSILGMKLVESLNQQFQIEMDAITLYDYSTIHTLSEYLMNQYQDIIRAPSLPHADENEVVSTPTPMPPDNGNLSITAASLQASLQETAGAESLNIAIVGMSGCFPGSPDVEAFWEHLARGDTLVQEATRWNLPEHYRNYLPEGKKYCTRGGFLDGIDLFDHAFFNISVIEARYMDPQQRIFLHQAWHALEDAGYAGPRIEGKRCGVYVGCSTGDYFKLLPKTSPAQAFWGNSVSVLASRIAYFLNLQGPAIAMDTACSSSLVAIHLACQGLLRKETDVALAGGVFVQCTPEFFTLGNRAGMLSPEGNCYTFDSRSDGFVPSEGAGAIVLKRLTDAMRDGDNILGVIKGSALNQDGASNGITAPRSDSQEKLIQEVYDTYGVHPDDIQMIEAHGTGTQLGDPIEFSALKRSFMHYTDKKNYCALGSVKTNIGHTTTASGMAGVLKILMALKHRRIPASLNYVRCNDKIDLADTPFFINTQIRPWDVPPGKNRAAAISAFGFSGTNAHMVIEAAPSNDVVVPLQTRNNSGLGTIVVLSAQSKAQLLQLISSLAQWCQNKLQHTPGHPLIDDIAYTLMTGRRHCHQRFAAVVATVEELYHTLTTILSDAPAGNAYMRAALHEKTSDSVKAHEAHADACIHQCHIRIHDVMSPPVSDAEMKMHQKQLSALADYFTKGYDFNYDRLFTGGGHRRISLPTYPFAKTSFWVKKDPEQENNKKDKQQIAGDIRPNARIYPFIHRHMAPSDKNGPHLFSNIIDLKEVGYAYIGDHRVGGEVWFPGAAFLEMAIEAMRHPVFGKEENRDDTHTIALKEVHFDKAVSFTDSDTVMLQLSVHPQNREGAHPFAICSKQSEAESQWLHNVSGKAFRLSGRDHPESMAINEYKARCPKILTQEEVYRHYIQLGFDYGPAFQGIKKGWIGDREALLQLAPHVTQPHDAYALHPALLDSVLQGALLAGMSSMDWSTRMYVASGVGELKMHGPPTGDGHGDIASSASWVVCKANELRSTQALFDFTVLDRTGEVLLEIKNFSLIAANQPKKFIYEVQWIKDERGVLDKGSIPDPATWLILSDQQGIGDSFAGHIPGAFVKVLVADNFNRVADNVYALNPEDKAQWRRLFEEAFNDSPLPDHIVHFWGLDAPRIDSAAHMNRVQALCCDSLLHLTQVIMEAKNGGPVKNTWTPQLSVVTQGTQATRKSEEVTHPQQALLWGFGASLALELPEFSITLMDLPADTEENRSNLSMTDALWHLIRNSGRNTGEPENRFALRWKNALNPPDSGQADIECLFPRLIKSPASVMADRHPDGAEGISVVADKSYLITGGLGHLGWVVVERLVALGAKHIITVGRHAPSAKRQARMRSLREQGIAVYHMRADVSVDTRLSAGFAGIHESAPEIAGIVHAAGILEDATLMTLDRHQIKRVLAPKVMAPQWLLKHVPHPEFFVMFSSIAGLLGSPGQSAYAASNAYLDAWSHHLAHHGIKSLSLNWGPWSEIGMASAQANRMTHIARSGLGFFKPGEGGDIFTHLLTLTMGRAVSEQKRQLVPVVFQPSAMPFEMVPPLLKRLVRDGANPIAEKNVPPRSDAKRHKAAEVRAISDSAAQRRWLEAYLGRTVAEITQESLSTILSKPLKELGMDSLMLLGLRNAIARELAVGLGTSALLDLTTMADMAGYIQGLLHHASNDLKKKQGNTIIQPQAIDRIAYRPVTRDVLRLLRTEQMGTPNAAHNIGLAVKLMTPISPKKLERFLLGTANRHAALRMSIVRSAENKDGYQFKIHPHLEETLKGPLLRQIRLTHPVDVVEESNRRLSALMAQPFEMDTAPLWRFELIETMAGEQVLLFGSHHAVSDFQSLLLFMLELDTLLAGGDLDDTVTNRDVDRWISSQVSELNAEDTQQGWADAFEGCERLDLTLSRPRSDQRTYQQGLATLMLPKDLYRRISIQAKNLKSTAAAYCLGVLSVLLARLSGQNRFVIAVPVDSRFQVEALDAFGFFGVPVPLPNEVNLEDPVAAVIQRCDRQFIRILQKGAAIADAVPALVRAGLNKAGAPLVEAYFNYIRPGFTVKHVEPLSVSPGLADIDLMVIFSAAMEYVSVYYNQDIIDAQAGQALGKAYIALLDELTSALEKDNPRYAVSQVRISEPLSTVWNKNSEKTMARPDPPEYDRKESQRSRVLALSATFSLGRLPELLVAAHGDAQQTIAVEQAPYHQVLAGLINPNGVFRKDDLSSGVILLRALDLVRFTDLTQEQLDHLEDEYIEALVHLNRKVSQPLVVGFLPSHLGDDSPYTRWDRQLSRRLKEQSSLVVLNASDWTRHYPVADIIDETADALGHMPFTPQFQAAVALTLTRTLWSLQRPPVKVVAVDGDHTLWQGMVGEMGADAVDLSGPYAVFADKLLALRDAGVLLVLVSNNDEATLLAVLDRADSKLKKDHFTIIAHGWNSKAKRLAQCAKRLNLGLDGFVFLDDHPVEIAEMRTCLPQVFSVTVPPEDELEAFLENLWALDVVAVTTEDRKRSSFYKEEETRQNVLNESSNFREFIETLELEMDFQLVGPATRARTTQLSRRIHQFKMRPQELDLAAMARLKNEGGEIWTASVKDRFGDYGQVCILVLQPKGDVLAVVNWMLSCRVLGRGVEDRVLQWLADHAEHSGCSEVHFAAQHHPRNTPARRLVAALGNDDMDAPQLTARVSLSALRDFKSWKIEEMLDGKGKTTQKSA